MLNKVSLSNYLGFISPKSTNDSVKIDFCDGVNIFIGENGTGKTSLLKLLYAFLECNSRSDTFSSKLSEMFDWNTVGDLFSHGANKIDIGITDEHRNNRIEIVCENRNVFNESILGKDYYTPSVFIPSKEMLSHSRGLIAMSRKIKIPFDKTLVDIVINAQLPESKVISSNSSMIMQKVSEVINGHVIYKYDAFYIRRNDGNEIIFSFEAEGLRKFGLLWKLSRNGLFDEPGFTLIWDEPEANLNPQLIPVLVDILLELQKTGIQIFIATHDYNLVRYFDIKRDKTESVKFHCLSKTDDGSIANTSSHNYSTLQELSPLNQADAALSDAIVQRAMDF